ncbi:MAG TPA: hypothetical protein VGN12_30010 [Pirellulales bacterium]|jgi:hypothetical protein
MRAAALLLAVSVLAGGCRTHLSLRDNTVATTETLTDLNYQQVLDNLARFVANPAVMPSLAIVNAGTVNVADQKGMSVNGTYAPTLTQAMQFGAGLPILSMLFNPSASRNLTENWSLAPVTDVDNLRRIRCAFQMVVSGDAEATHCIDCRELLERFYLGEQDDLECVIPTGWFNAGCEEDVAPNACYTGHCKNLYVWVTPDGLDGLTRFTMTVIDLATGKPHAPTKTVVRTYKADGTLDNMQVTTTEVDLEALEKQHKEGTRGERVRQYVTPPSVNPGMFFVPR